MSGAVFSSDPVIARKNLQWLEAIMLDDKDWMDDATRKDLKKEISDWAYDAEDAYDDWRFERLRAEAEGSPKQASGGSNARGTVADLLMDPSFRDRVNALLRKRRALWETYGQLPLEGLQPQGSNAEPLPTSSPTEPKIHGREEDKETLVGFLLREAAEYRLSVVPVLGVAGVGKTTLLQLMCDDEMVSRHFDLKTWVTASGGRQMIEVMKEIAEFLTRGPCNATQLGVVQNLLMQKIEGLKFLLVLDDVRYETIDGGQWEKLRSIFSNCADGSVVILTTQEERVAERMGTVPPYMLESLSSDLCWSVFRKHAFSGLLPTDEELVEIGQKIAEECQGSPLVAKALGLRLCNERDVAVWKKFLERRGMWDEVVPELKLSYHRLPAHLKRCFVYCSMFPEGYLFSREELVRLWMAQGFIREEKGRSLEEIGIKYFDDLIIRSFFQKSELDAGAFVMPNLLHALAQSISNGECITTENSDLSNLPNNYLQKPRHLSFTPSNSELPTNFLSIAMHLRSFVVVPAWPLTNMTQISITDETFDSLNQLRALDLSHSDIIVLPNSISNMKHLRYLNLSGSKIETVDASVFNQLYNLQTLNLSSTQIRELPDTIGNMSSLLHLCLNVTKIPKLPESIGKLSKLDTLHLGLTRIEHLPEAICSLKCLRFLYLNVSNIQCLPESMCEMSNLQTLVLQGTDDGESNNNVTSNDRDLEKQFNGQSGQIIHKQGVGDMADSSINSQTDHIDDQNSSSGCKTLPQLGLLPLLKELLVDGMSLEHIGNEFSGSSDRINGFPKLEKLSFQNMSEWKEWDGVREGDFFNLKELMIFNCPKLKGVPCPHSPLTKLKVKIERCAVESIPVTDSIEDLDLVACDNIKTLPSLSSLCNLTLMYCKNLTYLPTFPSLETFWIEECEKLNISVSDQLDFYTLSSTTFISRVIEENSDCSLSS